MKRRGGHDGGKPREAQQPVASKVVAEPAPIEYIRITAENANADVRRTY